MTGDSEIKELVRLQNVSLRLAQRITCDEEERQRFGYRLVSAYRFPEIGGKADRRDAEVVVGDTPILKASYGDATTLYRVNLGWANAGPTAPRGFLLDLERGYWASNPKDQDDANDAAAGHQMRVVPFVEDTKNTLVLRMEPVRAPGEMASLQAAFKQAIQKQFQLESRELAAEALPSSRERKEILFYEASEGGAGVLRQLVEDPTVIPQLARQALEICHFDPDTLEDTAARALRQGLLRVPARLRQPAGSPVARSVRDPRRAGATGEGHLQARRRHGQPRRADGGVARQVRQRAREEVAGPAR